MKHFVSEFPSSLDVSSLSFVSSWLKTSQGGRSTDEKGQKRRGRRARRLGRELVEHLILEECARVELVVVLWATL